MLSEKMQEALNDQLNFELYSAYIYLSMSAYFESLNLPGFANWMRVQTQEEVVHAMKFYTYINERNGRVILKGVKGPQSEWDSPLVAFEHAHEHECIVSGRINDLVNLAASEKDHATNTFLQWFVTEQVEEEANTSQVAQKLKMVADSPEALFMIDSELAQRVFTPPAAAPGAPGQ